MRGVSKRIVNAATATIVFAAIVVQPALATATRPEKNIVFGSLIRKIVRAFEEIHISLPPG